MNGYLLIRIRCWQRIYQSVNTIANICSSNWVLFCYWQLLSSVNLSPKLLI